MSKKLKKEFDIELDDAITYHKGGSEAYCKSLKLKAPANMHRDYILKLKQGFFQAIAGLPSNQGPAQAGPQDTDATITGTEVISILMMSKINLVEYFEVFKNLMCQGCCTLEDGTKMTSFIWDKLDIEDSERMLGEYLANFLLSSWITTLKKK